MDFDRLADRSTGNTQLLVEQEFTRSLTAIDPTDPAVAAARRIFQRVLAGWASDVLQLRRAQGSSCRWTDPAAGEDLVDLDYGTSSLAA